MKYDVFISYSRKDSEVANRVCEAFDRAGINYFIDTQEIGGAFEFPVIIAEAILECGVVLFLASKNSYESKFTNAELTFAFNEKPKNSVLPYIIDGSTMPPAMRFVFSSINWRNIDTHPIEPILVDDILQLLGRNPNEKKSIVTLEEKVYKVGDLYDDGVKQGVVFDVWGNGKHGKIVSLDQTAKRWCTEEQHGKGIVVGTSSESDGKANTDKVMARADSSQYPAFQWCRAKGAEWYLPAKYELNLLLHYDEVYKAVNKTLKQQGADKLSEKGAYVGSWSSSEYVDNNQFCAWYVGMYYGFTDFNTKFSNYYVRAVSAF